MMTRRRFGIGVVGALVLLQLSVRAADMPVTVGSVEFSGRMAVDEKLLRDTLSLKPGEPLTAAKVEADRKAILALGFFRSVGASQRVENGKARVTFRLVEWPKVSHVRVLGNTVVELKDIREVISTQVGQVLCLPQLQRDISAIEKLYRANGYVARISEKLADEASSTGILRFEILEIHIADLEFEGASEKVVDRCREVLKQVPPELYRPEEVAEDQKRLLKVKGVKRAEPKVDTTEPGKVRIRWILNGPAQ